MCYESRKHSLDRGRISAFCRCNWSGEATQRRQDGGFQIAANPLLQVVLTQQGDKVLAVPHDDVSQRSHPKVVVAGNAGFVPARRRHITE
jgi:hypothetical protein